MDKIVGLAVCYDKHNYGSMLQAYATQKILDNIGIANEAINLSGLNKIINRRKKRFFLIASLSSDFLWQKKGMLLTAIKKKSGFGKFKQNCEIRDKAFNNFEKRMFHISRQFDSFDELTKYCSEKYSVVIVGSDQLWLPGNIEGDFYTLNFVPDHIGKIAYATSFGLNRLPENLAGKTKFFLDRIDHIGVREVTGANIVRELTGKDVPVVCDPAMLLSVEEWSEIQEENPIINGDYILCYFLGKNVEHRQWVKGLKNVTGYKVIGLLHPDEYVRADEKYVETALYDVGPADFLNLIRNASYVCTDSFHCSLFSILYHRDFFSFRRYKAKTGQSTNSRLDTLFAAAGIPRPVLSGNEDVREIQKILIDYNLVDKCVSEYHDKSFSYLKNSLKEEGIHIADIE